MKKTNIEQAAILWVKSYKLRPKLTVSLTIISILSSIVISYYFNKIEKQKLQEKRLENQNFNDQLTLLNNTEKNLRNLIIFISEQKKSLTENEDLILKLKTEREKLQPLLKTEKELAEAIFRLQDERNSKNQWIGHTISFLLGILASLTASFIWNVFRLISNKAISAKKEI